MDELNELVKIEQLPKLIVQTKEIGKLIDKSLKDIDKLDCTEENKQEVKKRRTEINNTLKILEEKRKDIKKQIMTPYDEFNEIYENECKNKLQNASTLLGDKIDIIEKQQLDDKRQELIEFFDQYKESYSLNFLTFEDIKLNITLSASIKSLKEQIKEFVERVNNDFKLMEKDEYQSEIALEYSRNGYDYQRAKLTILERKEQEEKLKEQIEQKQNIETQEQEIIEKVQEIIVPKEIETSNDILEATFTIKTTMEKLKLLKKFLEDNDIEYE